MEGVDLNNIIDNNDFVVDLSKYKKSMSPGAAASKPKYVIDVDGDIVYFKFRLTAEEVNAEIFAYRIAIAIGIPVALTKLATYKGEIGIASFDIGKHFEPSDEISYSIKDFLEIKLFVELCLFDYLIMNEDRHCKNWGIQDGSIAPVFDHNICFSLSYNENNMNDAMQHLTSAFYVESENEYHQDDIIKYLAIHYENRVHAFVESLNRLSGISIPELEAIYPDEYKKTLEILKFRITYLKNEVIKWTRS